ncbi:MAG: hypothetical protein ABSC71_19810 [Candidatus Acidiferrales bacterium]|jgi:hypothetical protein
MFKKNFLTLSAKGDEGFEVNLRGLKKGLAYREGAHWIQLDTERNAIGAGWRIYIDSFKAWKQPYENEVIADAKRAQIKSRIRAALDFMKVGYNTPEDDKVTSASLWSPAPTPSASL